MAPLSNSQMIILVAFNSLHMTNLNRIEVFPGKGMNEVEENSTYETAVFHMFTSCVGIWSMA